MGQSASAYDGGDHYSDEEGDGSYYSSDDDEYSDEEEGYESESSSVMSRDPPAAAGGKRSASGDDRGEVHGSNRAQDASASVVDEQHRAQATGIALADPATNLEDLSATELKDLVDELEISREDLIAASRAIRRGQHPSSSSPAAVSGPAASAAAAAAAEPFAMGPASSSHPHPPSQGFYADDGHYATDVKVAMRILSASDHVRHLRFRLVPARLKEPIFWSSLLGILRYGKGWATTAEEERVAEQQHHHHHDHHPQEQQKQGDESRGRSGAGNIHNQHQNGGTATVGTAAAAAGATETESLRRHIRQRDVEVAQLRRALEASKAKIRSLEKEVVRKSAPKELVGSSAAPLPSAKAHKGDWAMDRDSQDFLALDEELKANLRGEKAKRLRDVREQMRFILDTDDVACSNGEWSCCKKKEYGCDGCAC